MSTWLCSSFTCSAGAGGSLLQHPKASPGRLALLSYQQMEVSSADEALLELAARSAALLAPLLYDTDLAAGRVPAAQGNGNLGGCQTPSVQSLKVKPSPSGILSHVDA